MTDLAEADEDVATFSDEAEDILADVHADPEDRMARLLLLMIQLQECQFSVMLDIKEALALRTVRS